METNLPILYVKNVAALPHVSHLRFLMTSSRYRQLLFIARNSRKLRYSSYSSCNCRLTLSSLLDFMRRTVIAQSRFGVSTLFEHQNAAQDKVALHLKGLHNHSRSVGDAPRAPIKMPTIATQTLTSVKMSCRDHLSCC